MANFITIDINSILNKNTTIDNNQTTPKNAPASAEQKPEQKKAGTKIDWSKELEKRLDDDKAKTSESRKGDFAVESEFWMDFFKTIWPENIAKLVDENIGEQLKKDIKILGFKVKSNPILAFLKTAYVQKELISTKLIDSYTYKAIHNALARPYIAKSEFSNVSDYNILFCRDLYTKSFADMEKYFAAQAKILPTNVSEYSQERIDRNKLIFLPLGKKSMRQEDAKLNSLEAVEKILGKITIEKGTKNSNKETSDSSDVVNKLDKETLSSFISSLSSSVDIAAGLQYIIMTTGSDTAASALAKIRANYSAEALAMATKKVVAQLNKTKIAKDDTEHLVRAIINKAAELPN